MTYPKRGCFSEDRKFYAHTDGSVHEVMQSPPNSFVSCLGAECSFAQACCNGRIVPCGAFEYFRVIEGAYVPTDEEQAAIDMARGMIAKCKYWFSWSILAQDCGVCRAFVDKTCPARVYIASKQQPYAWEVK